MSFTSENDLFSICVECAAGPGTAVPGLAHRTIFHTTMETSTVGTNFRIYLNE